MILTKMGIPVVSLVLVYHDIISFTSYHELIRKLILYPNPIIPITYSLSCLTLAIVISPVCIGNPQQHIAKQNPLSSLNLMIVYWNF